ncbi:uncharacterized protein LOC101889725 isoform X4 [Musca domestica]|uniref:Uncharacterized protein LOC101889725 isoform X4 n=1 Tax=Musca domestica TaxID=7370 RepID=A0ABM3V2I4_MUSDO|nr:uncharacterized protein LOC101889725 isoform X4 [Musca domestica]
MKLMWKDHSPKNIFSNKMRHIICLLDINPDCLVKIFSFCSEKDLQNLCKVHWMLRQVIENNIFSIKTLDLLMCGRRNNPIIMQRTQYALSFGKRMEISKNWLNGCYREQQYFHRTKMFPTKLFLDKEWLYLSYACYISQHKRLKNEAVQRKYFHEISSKNNNDISDFTKKHESIFAGRVSGGCFIYEDECMTEQQLHCPKEYLWCVDFERNLYVTSTDHCSKIWRRSEEMGLLHLDLVSNLNGSYKALQFSNDGFRLYGGLYDSIIDRRALHEIDVERLLTWYNKEVEQLREASQKQT